MSDAQPAAILTQISAEEVRELQVCVDDGRISKASRSLAVRRFCNKNKPNGPERLHVVGEEGHWTMVDTAHLLTISTNMALLSNYLVERVVASS